MYQLHYFPANANAQALPNETLLRVGPLELDLIDRTASVATGRSICGRASSICSST